MVLDPSCHRAVVSLRIFLRIRWLSWGWFSGGLLDGERPAGGDLKGPPWRINLREGRSLLLQHHNRIADLQNVLLRSTP